MSATALELWGVTITKDTADQIIEKAKQWALLHGVQMKPQHDHCSTCQCEYAPITLFPSPLPVTTLQEAKSMQKHYNLLMHRVAHDPDFLEQCFKKVLPENVPAHGLAVGFVKAWECYAKPSAVVLFIVQAVERNSVDQRWLERKMHEINHDVTVVYSTLLYASEHCQLFEGNILMLDGKEVAVIYYRDGYMPNHYPTHKEKDVRLLMEKSCAIKCPNVALQLAGCKKVQQELAVPGVLERFIKDKNACDSIRNTFAGQYSLDTTEEGDRNVEMALAHPKKFVLKPQREGGGNNIYGEDIKSFLLGIKDSEERNAYILMERIFPWPQKNYLLKEGKEPILRDVISELGIYGVYLGTAEEEFLNEEAGHVLRTKSTEDDEGGIVAGFATIDSPLLVQPPSVY
ncbi:glutathione synthetase-like [Mercenaria mercenaria]|uniref:glutathione synthetase-like n=1 Tax=Mercenaria mercenaria TaxID=6596 RepID=UPI00234E7984|nr:glutathione synthetase-like [Mercenaria mercenaria]